MNIIAPFTLFVLVAIQAAAQSLDVFDLDTSSFPVIRTKVYALDEKGAMQRLERSQLVIVEGGVPRTVTETACGQTTTPVPLSAVLMLDASQSMTGVHLDIAKAVSRRWIQRMDAARSECAVASFDTLSHIWQDLTSDTAALLRAVDAYTPFAGTSLDAALTDSMTGAFAIARNARARPVVIVVTDGRTTPTSISRILAESRRQNTAVFCLVIGMASPTSLREIAAATGGRVIDHLASVSEARIAVDMLWHQASGIQPCVVAWQSVEPCAEGTMQLVATWNGVSDTVRYARPSRPVPSLVFEPPYLRVDSPRLDSAVVREVKVRARNGRVQIRNIAMSNPRFTVEPAAFELAEGDSAVLRLSYAATDSAVYVAEFEMLGDGCPQRYYAKAGYSDVGIQTPALRLTSPVGGEVVSVGSQMLITWEGVMPTDTVRIAYSTDDGETWTNITTMATGLSYLWNDVPGPEGMKCRLKIWQVPYIPGYSETNPVPGMQMRRVFGGDNSDMTPVGLATFDKAFVTAFGSHSSDGDVDSHRGGEDVVVNKMNPITGEVLWQRTLGGTRNDHPNALLETADGNILLVGSTQSNDGDITFNAGYIDAWVGKLNATNGQIMWQRTLGGVASEYGQSAVELGDGTIVLAVTRVRSSLDIDVWIVRFDPSSDTILWEVTFGGTARDYAKSLIQAQDGSLLLAGYTRSTDGTLAGAKKPNGNTDGNFDYWIMKIRPSDGSLIWQKTYGGNADDYVNSMMQTRDGRIFVVGFVESYDGDVGRESDYPQPPLWTPTNADCWLLELDTSRGDLVSKHLFGGTANDKGMHVAECSDGSLLLAAQVWSRDRQVRRNNGKGDIWVVKLDPKSFDIRWQASLGGSLDDCPFYVGELFDASVMITAEVNSKDGDVRDQRIAPNVWVARLAEPSAMQADSVQSTFAIIETLMACRDVDLGSCALSHVKDTTVSAFIVNSGRIPTSVERVTFVGADAAAFSLAAGDSSFTVAPATGHPVEIRFRPLRAGVHRAQIRIETQADTLLGDLAGIGVANVYVTPTSLLDVGPVSLGSHADKRVAILRNTDTLPMMIRSIRIGAPNQQEFTLESGGERVLLQPGQTHVVDLRFVPSVVQRVSSRLLIDHDGPGSPTVIRLFGRGVADTIRTTVAVGDVQATAGQPIHLVLNVVDAANGSIPLAPTNFIATIAIPSSVLHITDPAIQCIQVDSATCHVRVSGSRGNDPTLAAIPAMATLGTTDYAPLRLVDFAWQNTPHATVVTRVDGTIRITNACSDGSPRLFIPAGSVYSLACRPNPVEADGEIYYGVAEAGRVTIDVIDRAGRTVATPVHDQFVQPGAYLRYVNVRQLSAGPYMVVLRGANITVYTRMDVVR